MHQHPFLVGCLVLTACMTAVSALPAAQDISWAGCAGGKRPLTLPVQANGITSYFPTLPANSEALRQFAAPRTATRLNPNSTPSQRHSCAPKPSSAVDSDCNELQHHAGRHPSAISHATTCACVGVCVCVCLSPCLCVCLYHCVCHCVTTHQTA